MTKRSPKEPKNPRAAERARDESEPGAHSGAESTARDRSIKGTASSTEGYRTKGGTGHGDALEGVREQPSGKDERRQGRRRGGRKADDDR
ncbi:hypothetical protein [Streptomyces sp. URMC 123]|uniref:hypothetical protein n=1 Tax=Streptomyces sp. URMC 123 TaxID=3423403 RepID=UPI003F1CD910